MTETAAASVDVLERLARALARGQQLLELTQRLQTALTPDDVGTVITTQARAALGVSFAGIALVDPGRRVLTYLCLDPLPEPTVRTWTTFPIDTQAPVAAAARLGQAYFHESTAQAEADFPGITEHMREAGTGAMAHLPLLVGDGQPLGSLAFCWPDTHEMSPAARDFMVTAAGATAQAMQRAQLYAQQLSVADALQGAVLPTDLPEHQHWRIEGRFVPATEGMQVGGDWYDAFTLPGGGLGCVIGDAAGHGLPAARVMSSVRNAVRAYAMLGEGPASTLTRVDRMLEALDPEAMATVIYLEVDADQPRLSISVAGHPPPLSCPPDGAAHPLTLEPDPPLGCPGRAPRREDVITLADGGTLLLYTDGLVERRGEDFGVGLDRLIGTVQRVRAQDDSSGDRLARTVAMMTDGRGFGDDVCAMTVHRRRTASSAPTGAGQVVHNVLEAAPESVGLAREVVRAWLHRWQLAERRDEIVLVVSELVTNAVMHAHSDVELTVGHRDGWLRIEVSDRSRLLPRREHPEPIAEHGRGVALVELLADRWGTEALPGGKRVWVEFRV